jgi:hypothetical protein
MDDAGELYVLEVNPNCGIFYELDSPGSADLILMHDPVRHSGFVERLLAAGLARARNRENCWVQRLGSDHNFAIIARRDIVAGEVIEAFEKQAHSLVSLREVERTWSAAELELFARYAYPISANVYSVWQHSNPNWKLFAHSCDPTAWIDGLNIVARRPIAEGEQISLDYATFCNEVMPSFVCTCGSEQCRMTITGRDYLSSCIDIYGDHISAFVKVVRQQHSGASESAKTPAKKTESSKQNGQKSAVYR